MWIEAKKLAANKLNLKCVEDPRLRLDIGKVTDVIANNRKVALGNPVWIRASTNRLRVAENQGAWLESDHHSKKLFYREGKAG